jgi:hypothetical protein
MMMMMAVIMIVVFVTVGYRSCGDTHKRDDSYTFRRGHLGLSLSSYSTRHTVNKDMYSSTSTSTVVLSPSLVVFFAILWFFFFAFACLCVVSKNPYVFVGVENSRAVFTY